MADERDRESAADRAIGSRARYEPTSRRPIASLFRRTGDGPARWLAQRGVSADAISWLSLLVAALSAVCYWQAGRAPLLLLIAPLLAYLRLYFNMLDGMVALEAGTASRRGEIINELPDRGADLLIFVGIAHSGLCEPLLAYWAAIAALLCAYVRTLAQAVGVSRQFDGVMSKPLRMVVLHLGSWILLAMYFFSEPEWTARRRVMDLTLAIILIGCAQTIWVRLRRSLRVLSGRESGDEHHGKGGTD